MFLAGGGAGSSAAVVVVFCRFFSKLTFKKIVISGIKSACQTVWIKIRPDILSGLIRVQYGC